MPAATRPDPVPYILAFYEITEPKVQDRGILEQRCCEAIHNRVREGLPGNLRVIDGPQTAMRRQNQTGHLPDSKSSALSSPASSAVEPAWLRWQRQANPVKLLDHLSPLSQRVLAVEQVI